MRQNLFREQASAKTFGTKAPTGRGESPPATDKSCHVVSGVKEAIASHATLSVVYFWLDSPSQATPPKHPVWSCGEPALVGGSLKQKDVGEVAPNFRSALFEDCEAVN
eukprot:1700802-Amphidinium_carterae.1